ncbi:hypothetical protein HJC23_010191 [Cyclotella cryptica]|uniref:Uncharacterized protein n=1 Tax=Cyclotella cryptica TaxID=29204 RepID=A0ABD3PHH3_9STRA
MGGKNFCFLIHIFLKDIQPIG